MASSNGDHTISWATPPTSETETIKEIAEKRRFFKAISILGSLLSELNIQKDHIGYDVRDEKITYKEGTDKINSLIKRIGTIVGIKIEGVK